MKVGHYNQLGPDPTKQVFELPSNKRCPFCRKKLIIDGPEKRMYKSEPIWIDNITRKATVRCNKCDIILIEK